MTPMTLIIFFNCYVYSFSVQKNRKKYESRRMSDIRLTTKTPVHSAFFLKKESFLPKCSLLFVLLDAL